MTTNIPDLSVYWKTVLDTIQDAIFIMDSGGNIISSNQAAEEMTGYKEPELIGKSCTTLGCTGCVLYGEGKGEKWCSLFSMGNVVDKRCTISAKSGERLNVIKSASVLYDKDGEIMGAVEALADISDMVKTEREIISLRRSLGHEDGFYGILGHSGEMQRLFDLIQNAAFSDAPVFVAGESGTGKELVARALHELSSRSSQPFIKVNCAALNQNLLETELFGHVKGAFTGADRTRKGRFEAAHMGTIFLDEIGDVPLPTQVKLLRVLEEKEIERVGDHRPIPVNVRFITATNRNLNELMQKGEFRHDLYYRINVVPIKVPALRRRREDIPYLAQAFVNRLKDRTQRPIEGFSSKAMSALYNYSWPGNVRELKNAIEYAFVLCHGGVIKLEHLPERIWEQRGERSVPDIPKGDGQRAELVAALRSTGGNQTKAAEILGVSRMTVWKRLKKHNINIRSEIS